MNCRAIFFFIGIVSLMAALLFPPLLAVSAETGRVLTVDTGQLTLDTVGSPYTFSGITVKNGAELIIDPGVTIYLLGGAEVRIDGKLHAVGTSDAPIILTANNQDAWQGMTVSAQATTSTLAYISFQFFQGPIQVLNLRPSLHNLELIDGVDNSLEVGDGSQAYSTMNISDIAFRNYLRGNWMRSEGIRANGSWKKLTVTRIAISDNRPPTELDWSRIGVSMLGAWGERTLNSITFPSGCQSFMKINIPGQLTLISSDPSRCPGLTLPVVFIPGYGTSINLKVLQDPLPQMLGPDQGVWQFFHLLTPSYDQLFSDLTQNKVPYTVAYYDWRMPAAEAAVRYLEPIIEETKRKYNVEAVNIVAHSFGGIVARAYIQSDQYRGDVQNLVQLGTPNYGTAKVYAPWEGGVLPEDWSPLFYLLRYYQYQYREWQLDDQQAIHTFFPSLRELLPTYPAYFYQDRPKDPSSLVEVNRFLNQENDNLIDLQSRVRVVDIYSATEPTLTSLYLDGPSSVDRWPDGQPVDRPEAYERNGDGTVPVESAVIPGSISLPVNGEHMQVPAVASPLFFPILYPTIYYRSGPLSIWELVHSFLFDCPVEVTITLPDGRTVSSEQNGLSADGSGEALRSDNLIWIVVPDQPGDYHLMVRARTDTEARGWVDNQSVNRWELRQGQTVDWQWSAAQGTVATTSSVPTVSPPTPTASPSPAIDRPRSAEPTPMPPVESGIDPPPSPVYWPLFTPYPEIRRLLQLFQSV
ncbi:alpha/beta hydrolase [Patescibacteria group bacterium]|nr:alpha/beta hydrolase [Patescibacteria group bacterium]